MYIVMTRKHRMNIQRRDTKNNHRPGKRRNPPMPRNQTPDAR
jgi:hypothetical protein